MEIFHKKQWDFLKKKFELNQLSHAYLFSGVKGIGKKDFALNFIEFTGSKFPDLIIIEEANKKDEKFGDGGEINISQIRKIQSFLSYKSYNGSLKTVVINEAEKMNTEAQNCLLKSLEEPKGDSLIILISSKPDILLPTIISRCQNLKFFKTKDIKDKPEQIKKEEDILNEFLTVANSNFANKFNYVKSIGVEKYSAGAVIEIVQKYIRHLIMVKIGVEQKMGRDNDFLKYDIEKLKNILNITDSLNKKLFFTNASEKLALEILLIEM